jgi:5-methylthioadenosine/S-adenosylhomocysteine deaminase
MQNNILLKNVILLPLVDGQTELVDNGFLHVKDGRIAAQGPMAELPAEIVPERSIDGAGSLLMPGLINTHTHAPMTLFRGLADDL